MAPRASKAGGENVPTSEFMERRGARDNILQTQEQAEGINSKMPASRGIQWTKESDGFLYWWLLLGGKLVPFWPGDGQKGNSALGMAAS